MKIHVILEKLGETRPASISVYFEQIASRLAAAGGRFTEGRYEDTAIPSDTDIIWAPGMGNRRLPRALFSSSVPSAVTVHGLQYLMAPPMIRQQGFRRGLGHYLWRRRIRRDWAQIGNQIGAVISVSETLGDQISRQLGVSKDRIHPIQHGVSELFFSQGKVSEVAPDAPILHVSQFSKIKNYERMMHAFELTKDRISRPFHLVSVDYRGDRSKIPEGCTLTTDRIPHERLPAIFGRAYVFLFPSLEEAFGLPVLEAMAAGVPVVTSRGTGAAEVAGDAAILVDPLDTDDIARGLVEACTNFELRAQLRKRGIARARQFDWDTSATKHQKLFEDLVSSANRKKLTNDETEPR